MADETPADGGFGPWTFDPESNDICLQGCPVFQVYRESDFPCIEDDDRAEADLDYLTHATVAVMLLNTVATTKEPTVGDAIRQLARVTTRPDAGAEASELDSYEKFDGVGPHSETIETRARIGERYLEAYESALSDPRLTGYTPADCPSELLLDLLNGAALRTPPPAAERVERLEAAAKALLSVFSVDGKHMATPLDVQQPLVNEVRQSLAALADGAGQ